MIRDVQSFHPKERFSNRVEAYVKYRPHYPPEIIPFCREKFGLSAGDVIADIGSGTGFLSELYLENGNTLYGIEPNKEMREAGEKYLNRFPNFRSIDANAEQTLLRDRSVDVVIAGQAFHWFDQTKFQAECKRILRDKSIACLIWNERDNQSTEFLRAYEELLGNYSTDYYQVRHEDVTEGELQEFFGSKSLQRGQFPNNQIFDFEGVRGRLLSASYIPTEDHPRYGEMIALLKSLFEKQSKNGKVELLYKTQLYWGKVS